MDFYINGEIFVNAKFSSINTLKDYDTKYPVQGEHNFTDRSDVTGRYELQRQVKLTNGINDEWTNIDEDWYYRAKEDYRRIIAIPTTPVSDYVLDNDIGTKTVYSTTPVNGDKQEAKEKAKELVERFRFYVIGQPDGHAELQNAKQCALICLTEIEQALTDYGRETYELQNMDRTFHHLDNIKTEITNL